MFCLGFVPQKHQFWAREFIYLQRLLCETVESEEVFGFG